MFVLHDIQGYEHHEIAKILGRSVGDSKSQLHKARTRLRELLHELQREKAREERLAAPKTLSRSSETLLVFALMKERALRRGILQSREPDAEN
jgi:transposase